MFTIKAGRIKSRHVRALKRRASYLEVLLAADTEKTRHFQHQEYCAIKAVLELVSPQQESDKGRAPPSVFGPSQEFKNGEGKWIVVAPSMYGMKISDDAQENGSVRWEGAK